MLVRHSVGVPEIGQVLIKVYTPMVTLDMCLEEDLLKELSGAGLDGALVETAVVPGDAPRTVDCLWRGHQTREILEEYRHIYYVVKNPFHILKDYLCHVSLFKIVQSSQPLF